MKFKKLILSFLLATVFLTGCQSKSNKQAITVVSREEGSGTRSAFVELTGVLKKDGDEKIDQTTEEAIIQMQTETVIKNVESDKNAIGYISTGSLSERVKALNVDGVEPSQENIKSGSYKISRPFILVQKEENPLVNDFIKFILSKEGQNIISEDYIAYQEGESYQSSNLEGKIVVAGSTSVSPIMEKLKEEYTKLNNVDIEIQQTGSSAGINSSIEGSADIGMSSRALSEEEKSQLKETTIALDGIAVIVNKENTLDDISLEKLRSIFLGEIEDWEEI